MTKEMRPAHRADVLTHALVYYAFVSKQKLGNEILKYVMCLLLAIYQSHVPVHNCVL